jgi:molybdenum-dependent DNA-binding transcriptional regulator ModE
MIKKPKPPLNVSLVERRLKLKHFHTVAAVAKCGSMGKAARQLAVSQPVVSKAIADVEHLLGVRLLIAAAKASNRRNIAGPFSSVARLSSMM